MESVCDTGIVGEVLLHLKEQPDTVDKTSAPMGEICFAVRKDFFLFRIESRENSASGAH